MRILASLVLALAAFQAHPQAPAEVRSYLERLLKEHPPGIGERYAGTFGPLPDQLQTQADKKLSKHRFVIADLFYSHWAPDDGSVKILLVLDASSGQIVAHSWSPRYSGHSESFATLLQQYQPVSISEAAAMAHTLAEMLAATSSFQITGRRVVQGQIELDLTERDRVFRLLRVPFNLGSGFGRTVLINPITGHPDEALVFPVEPSR